MAGDEVDLARVSNISDAYLQFIAASFSMLLLPVMQLTEKRDITGKLIFEICLTGSGGGLPSGAA